jgi:hypothetical protein
VGHLPIAAWIRELNEAIAEAVPLINRLRHFGKYSWASQLSAEVQIMREAIAALERIAQHQGKRMGRPPRWLLALNTAHTHEAKASKRANGKAAHAGG